MKNHSKRSLLLGGLFAAACVLMPVQSQAQDAGQKLGRGLAGLLAGWVELPGNIYDESNRHGWVSGATLGFAKGIGMTVARTLVGAYEFITFPIPAPDEYNPILKPEYPWSYFSGEGEVIVPASSVR
jgi:putative exosortase-associated protein (TIGR04073 family)